MVLTTGTLSLSSTSYDDAFISSSVLFFWQSLAYYLHSPLKENIFHSPAIPKAMVMLTQTQLTPLLVGAPTLKQFCEAALMMVQGVLPSNCATSNL
ncbi:hypothetical protein DSO57_1031756 [Entomophthora muscae]|uniref:Uncharacterized protein n=1 Tax=Entomophthora muscae TaxID=34485 RepID=A0ACC2UAD2_9FUNG|nr:hypothetical protein DSO57_1031756 [Entomophthora muscae]